MVACFEEACKKYNAEYTVEVERAYDAYLFEKNDPFLEYTRKRVEAAGLTPEEAASGGGSDTNVYNANGIKALNLGIGMSKCHTLEEFIKVEHLNQSAELVYQMITEFWKSDLN